MAGVDFPVHANTQPAVKDLDKLIDQFRKVAKEAGMTDKQIDEITKSTKQAGDEGSKNINKINKEMGGLNTVATKAAGILGGLFALDKIKDFVGEVVRVTSEFQKLEAVLTNTLGTKSEAQRSMKTLQEIAAKTPFSVLQLTQSYVKLVNQGFKPTSAEIIKLGDLAASTGKEFDQLTEAIIDAQTGEFERLKEFGIRASKAGDQVTFTFKGVETQTQFTSAAIREYILALGDAEGVSGAMAAISETLGGQLSNLGDSWDTLMNTLGDGQKGPLSGVVDALNEFVIAATAAVRTEEQWQQLRKTSREVEAEELLRASIKAYKTLDDARRGELAMLDAEEKRLKARNDEMYRGIKFNKEEQDQNYDRLEQIKVEREVLDQLINSLRSEEDAKNKAAVAAAKLNSQLDATMRKQMDDYRKSLKNLKDEAVDFGEATKDNGDTYGDKIRAEIDKILTDGMTPEDKELSWFMPTETEPPENFEFPIDQVVDYSIMAIDEVFNYKQFNAEREAALLKQSYDYELRLAGDNDEAKEKINRDFAKREAALQEKQSKIAQEQAVFQILISQGPAIARAFAEGGPFAALSLIPLIIGIFAAQLNRTRSAQTPRFAATGEFDIDGPGTETSDSIPYMLSRHESVVHAKGSKKFGPILKQMIENPNLEYSDIRNIVDQHLPSGVGGAIFVQAKGADSSELIEEMRATRHAIMNKREFNMTLDEDGFGLYIGKAGDWTKIVAKRYSLKP